MTFSLDEFLGDGDDDYTVDVPIKPKALAKKHAELEHLISQSIGNSDSLAGPSDVTAMAEALKELEQRIEDKTRIYRFRPLTPRRWRALKAEHPPKKQHRDMGLDFDAETFPPAAIAACSVDPKLTVSEAQEIEDDPSFSSGDFDLLWQGVLNANLGVLSDTPKSELATAILRMSAASSTTAARGESPEASS